MPLYGSSRLGEWRPNRLLEYVQQEDGKAYFAYYRGEKTYELSNHLGNVLAIVSDALESPSSGGVGEAQIVSATDYYAFGQELPGRTYQNAAFSEVYRYGFNGKERDNDFWGEGNAYDFGGRILDPRLGRWLSLDPLAAKYPDMSPYNSMGNNPVLMVDPDGRDNILYIVTLNMNPNQIKELENGIGQANKYLRDLGINTQVQLWKGCKAPVLDKTDAVTIVGTDRANVASYVHQNYQKHIDGSLGWELDPKGTPSTDFSVHSWINTSSYQSFPEVTSDSDPSGGTGGSLSVVHWNDVKKNMVGKLGNSQDAIGYLIVHIMGHLGGMPDDESEVNGSKDLHVMLAGNSAELAIRRKLIKSIKDLCYKQQNCEEVYHKKKTTSYYNAVLSKFGRHAPKPNKENTTSSTNINNNE